MTSMIDHELFQRSELLIQNLLQTINQPPFDRSSRVCASGNLCQISIEHSCGVRALSETRMFPSAFVVLRAQFESLLRGVWVLYCANDDEVLKLSAHLDPDSEQGAKNLASPHDMLKALGLVPNAKVPFDALTEFKDSSWKALNSFAHAGIHPLHRLVDGYPIEMVLANVRMSNALALMAGMQYCVLTGIPGLQKELTPLHERFADCLPDHRAPIRTN